MRRSRTASARCLERACAALRLPPSSERPITVTVESWSGLQPAGLILDHATRPTTDGGAVFGKENAIADVDQKGVAVLRGAVGLVGTDSSTFFGAIAMDRAKKVLAGRAKLRAKRERRR